MFTAFSLSLRRGINNAIVGYSLPRTRAVAAVRNKSTLPSEDAPITLSMFRTEMHVFRTEMRNEMHNEMHKLRTEMHKSSVGLGGLMISLFAGSVILVQQTTTGTNMKFEALDGKIAAQDGKIAAQDKVIATRKKQPGFWSRN